MKNLLVISTYFFTLFGSSAQNRAPVKVQYYCAPCGCSNDGKILENGGICPICKMRLLKVGTFNYEMPSVSTNGSIVYVSNQLDNKPQMFYKSINSSSKAELIGEGTVPQISADDEKIVFNRKEGDICVYNIKGGSLKDITSKINLPGLQTPSWCSAGNCILFTAGTFPNLGIYKMNLDSNKVEPLIIGDGLRYGCMMSADGKRIAYRCVKGKTEKERQRGIAIYDIESKEEKYITHIGEYSTWSPDGKRLAFHWHDSTDFCIYVVNSDGTGLKKIAETKGSDSELPVWSADGKKIFFQTNRRQGNWEIWTMNNDGSNQKPLIWQE